MRGMRGYAGVVVAVATGLLATAAGAAPIVLLDQPSYTVAPGGSLTVNVLIDGDSSAPGLQPVAGGLQSAGILLKFSPVNAVVPTESQVVVVPALDDDGFGGPPTKRAVPGEAGFSGFVEFLSPSYTGNLLATITLTNLALSGSYQITPDLFYPLNDSRTNFVDGSLEDIDALITFAPSTVSVPEPGTAFLVTLVAGGLLARRRR